MRSIVIFLTITSRPPTAVTTCLGLDARGRHEALDGLGHDAGVHDLTLDNRVVGNRDERHLGQHRTTGGVGDRDELDQAAPDVQADRDRLPPKESHRSPLVEEYARISLLQRATDVPHKLHFGNPLRGCILTSESAKYFTRFTPPYLLFRKRSLGMQQ